MTSLELSTLSYSELLKLSEQLNQKIETQRTEELKVLADGYVKKAQAAGFSLQEAMDALQPYASDVRSKRKATGPVKALYQDPANPENTWSGRGMPAKWLAAYESHGRSRDEFKVR